MLYAVRKDEPRPLTYSDRMNEIYYARKPYALVDYLGGSYNDYFSPVEKNRWDSLMEITNELFKKYDGQDLYNALYAYEEGDTNLLTDRQKEMVNYYMQWYDEHFNLDPYCGYANTVGRLMELRDLNPRVQDIYNNPEVDLYQVVDY